MGSTGEAGLEGLKTNFRGQVVRPGDLNYDEVRMVWNGLIDKRPKFILRCQDENDVVSAVKFAVDNGLTCAVRGGGHNVAGFATCDEGVVIDLSPMKKITVDPVTKTASAQGGLTWGEFDKATQQYALATTGGLVTETGIAGLTLGGGIGWLMREHGLALDNLLSAEMVLADGRRVKVSENENRDLFWAIRGGGGNFGIVTTFNFRLHPVGPVVYGGAVFYTIDKAKELLTLYSDWVESLPDKASTLVAFLTAPPAPFIPQDLQGKKVAAVALCYNGEAAEGEMLVKPLRSFTKPDVDLLGPIPYLQLQSLFDESVPRGILSYWKTEYLRKIDQDVIGLLIEYAEKMQSPMSQIHIQNLGGAVSRVDEEATAFSHRNSNFVLNMIGMWTDPKETEKNIAWVRAHAEAVKKHSTGAAYLNFLVDVGDSQLKAAYGEKKLRKLVELKNKYDPKNTFCVNQNIKPTV